MSIQLTPQYEIGTQINAGWDKDHIQSTGKIIDSKFQGKIIDNEFRGGWFYRIVFDRFDYTKFQEYWYSEGELKEGFVTKW